MTDIAPAVVSASSRRSAGGPLGALRRFVTGISAIGVKELRGRMRGRRAFLILTSYLLLLALIAWGWEVIAERAYGGGVLFGGAAAFASAQVGQEVFGALILVQTLLVVFLAPALTAQAISLEREKQTLDMLSSTPIPSLAVVLGKLLSALTFVFILIAASLPLTAIVFVFGGVSPDDVLRGYTVLIVSAIGLGSVGLFFSALFQRTQTATVVTFFGVLALTLGTMFAVLFWSALSGTRGTEPLGQFAPDEGTGPIRGRPPAALLWFNPFAAQYDVICGASDGYGGWCSRLSTVTSGAIGAGLVNGPIVNGGDLPMPAPAVEPGIGIGVTTDAAGIMLRQTLAAGTAGEAKIRAMIEANAAVPADVAPIAFGVARDSFWPTSMAAWLILSAVLILASVQLVSPTRRWRLRRPSGRAA